MVNFFTWNLLALLIAIGILFFVKHKRIRTVAILVIVWTFTFSRWEMVVDVSRFYDDKIGIKFQYNQPHYLISNFTEEGRKIGSVPLLKMYDKLVIGKNFMDSIERQENEEEQKLVNKLKLSSNTTYTIIKVHKRYITGFLLQSFSGHPHIAYIAETDFGDIVRLSGNVFESEESMRLNIKLLEEK